MSPIPWSTILTHGPALVASARRFLAATETKDVREGNSALDVRLEDLQRASVESARLVHDIAQQVQALTVAQQEAVRRGRIAMTLAVAAVVVAIGAAIVALTR